jgi:tripeptidyl-peptidase-1
LEFDLEVGKVERLLETEYWVWRHEELGKEWVKCERYLVPERVKENVDFITPTVHFDGDLWKERDEGRKIGRGKQTKESWRED